MGAGFKGYHQPEPVVGFVENTPWSCSWPHVRFVPASSVHVAAERCDRTMIKRIYIDNYKSFVNFDLRLQDLTLLVGRNGSGKTAVLDVVYALRNLLDGTARVTDRDVFPPASLTRWQARSVQTFRVDVELDGDAFEYRLEVEHDRREGRARITLETLLARGGPLFGFEGGQVQLYRDNHSKGPVFSGDWRESALARVAPARTEDNRHLTRFLEFMRGVLVCGLNPRAMASESSTEDVTLDRDGQNFVGWYRHLMQERQHLSPDYVQAMRGVLDGLRGFRLEKTGSDTRALSAVFGEADEAHEFKFRELSDGQRTLAALYAIIILTASQGTALFIDEPVNYVGLREIQPWLVALADACGSEVPQTLLCSHHPEVIDYLGGDVGVLLQRDGTGPTRAEPLTDGLEAFADGSPLRLSELMARGWER